MRRELLLALAMLVGLTVLPAAFAVAAEKEVLPSHAKNRAAVIEKLYSYLVYPKPPRCSPDS